MFTWVHLARFKLVAFRQMVLRLIIVVTACHCNDLGKSTIAVCNNRASAPAFVGNSLCVAFCFTLFNGII